MSFTRKLNFTEPRSATQVQQLPQTAPVTIWLARIRPSTNFLVNGRQAEAQAVGRRWVSQQEDVTVDQFDGNTRTRRRTNTHTRRCFLSLSSIQHPTAMLVGAECIPQDYQSRVRIVVCSRERISRSRLHPYPLRMHCSAAALHPEFCTGKAEPLF